MLIANVIGPFLFLYLYWKKLKEDYSTEKIFNSSFILLMGISLGLLVSRFFLVDYWFWVAFLVIIFIDVFIVFKLKIKLFESLDALIISVLPWLSLFYLSDSIVKKSLSSFLAFWISLVCIFLFFFFDNFYKTFSWYKSGRVGFSGLAVLVIAFLIRAILLTTNYERIFSATVVFVSFLLLFNLSKKND